MTRDSGMLKKKKKVIRRGTAEVSASKVFGTQRRREKARNGRRLIDGYRKTRVRYAMVILPTPA